MLVQRASDGDGRAFAALYERFAPMVHAVLLSRAPTQDAEDLLQEVFVIAWRKLHQLRRDEHVGGWLASVARRAAARHLARRRPPPDALAAEPVDSRAGRDDAAEILAELRALPDAYRETLAMRLVEGMTGPEIAEATGLTPGSVRVNLTRGMKLLKERLARAGWP